MKKPYRFTGFPKTERDALRKEIARLKEENYYLKANLQQMEQRNRYLIRAENRANILSSFLSALSQELRTPLNAVRQLSRMLAREAQNNSTEKKSLTISRTSDALLDLIDRYKRHTLPSGQQEAPNHKSHELEEVVYGIVQLLDGHARGKGIELRLDIAPEALSMGVSDAVPLQQALINLVDHAISNTASGYVQVSLVCGSGSDASALVVLEDSGRLPEETCLGQIFGMTAAVAEDEVAPIELLHQCEPHNGCMNLRTSKELIEEMGGQAQCYPSKVGGSKLVIELPVTQVKGSGYPREIAS